MKKARLRIGIDVGGTFTKAVAVDADTLEISGIAVTPTTHGAEEGVAKGVVYVFQKLLDDSRIPAEAVVFLAHSTTQATNALLEGDVAPVGVVGMGAGSFEAIPAKSQTVIEDIEVASGRFISSKHTFMDTGKGLTNEEALKLIEGLCAQGACAIVAAEAFGVDDPTHERLIMDVAAKRGLPATATHEISKLYGLKIRTRTAVINASILTKMIETAEMTHKGVRATGITAPLMVMRGDAGVMDINEMRRRPILTALSGPAASVAGVLFYVKVSQGIYFEVGGTTTNMGVIKNGRPMFKHVVIGGHNTFLHSLDVRVLAVAGGSMPRVDGGKVVDVGPRSAHIAGLEYSTFATPEDIESPRLVNLKLKKGDPTDYVGIETSSGKQYALTNTCAANVLGIVKEGDYSFGNPAAARKAFAPLAAALGTTVEGAAAQVLDMASGKIIKIVNSLIEEYKLDAEGSVLIGGGGGAAAMIPYVSQKTGLKYQISSNAEVISSIGDALAMVRETVERTIINPTPEDVLRVRKECEQGAIASGAAPGTIEVFVNVDSVRNRVTATAVGATEFVSRDVATKNLPLPERKKIAAESMRVAPEIVEDAGHTTHLNVFTAQTIKRGLLGFKTKGRKPVRVVDQQGVIRLMLRDGECFPTTVGGGLEVLSQQGRRLTKFSEMGDIVPPAYFVYGARVFDMSGLITLDEYVSMVKVEIQGIEKEQPAVVVFDIG